MEVRRLFTDHPGSVGETYGEHLLRALGFGLRMISAGAACIVHALLPFLFVSSGSRAVAELNEQMVLKRSVARGSVPELPSAHSTRA
jgi:Family of unknown function (DUF6356)